MAGAEGAVAGGGNFGGRHLGGLQLPAAVTARGLEKLDSVGPGQRLVTLTPVPRNSSNSASLNDCTNALLA